MNIKKIYRLGNKEIRYIMNTRNKTFFSTRYFNVNIIPQYSGNFYNKFGISISSKFSKKAIYRNIIRRLFFDYIAKHSLYNKKSKYGYFKLYVSLKKGVDWDYKSDNFKKDIKYGLERYLFDKLF